jgi:hypothetical protein
MTKRERARKLIADFEQRRGCRFYLLANGEFGVALGNLQLTRTERRQLEHHAEQIAEIVFQRMQVMVKSRLAPEQQSLKRMSSPSTTVN